MAKTSHHNQPDRKFILAVDFDGTIRKHAEYPKAGSSVPGAADWLHRFRKAGAKSFLWTCRDGEALDIALAKISKQGIVVDGVNNYEYWDGFVISKKLFANVYIDDAAAGAPLIHPPGERPYLNWNAIGPAILDRIRNNLFRPI